MQVKEILEMWHEDRIEKLQKEYTAVSDAMEIYPVYIDAYHAAHRGSMRFLLDKINASMAAENSAIEIVGRAEGNTISAQYSYARTASARAWNEVASARDGLRMIETLLASYDMICHSDVYHA